MLALKLAEINWMTGETGETPILLLDEVVAELDDKRRRLLLDYVQRGAQALLTATDPGMLSDAFLAQSTNMRVERGRVQPAVILPDG
jgi:DNA replication and repair protein RecF